MQDSKPIFIDTWFLASGRFPICVRPRKLRLCAAHFTDAQEFEKQCRLLWQDLDNGESIHFQMATQAPQRMPSIKFHLVLVQGEWTGNDWTLFHSGSLPLFQRLRAVLFPRGCTVFDFFRQAQVMGNCNSHQVVCFVKARENGHEVYQSTWDIVRIPDGRFIEGDLRRIDPSDDGQSQASSTEAPGDSDTNDHDVDDSDDQSSLMSAHPISHQLDHPDPYPWQTDAIEDFDDTLLAHEDQNPVVHFAEDHMDHLLSTIRDLTGGDLSEEPPWMATTFGLGLLDLGRRDILFNPNDMPGLLQDVKRVWADHLQYGDLLLYTVHPQPVNTLGARTVAIIVVVDMPETLDPTIRHTLVIEQSVNPGLIRPAPYAARLISETSAKEILVHLNLHSHCPPYTLRSCHVRLGTVMLEKNQFYEYEHGTLCRPWIGHLPFQVVEAEHRVAQVESFFLQVQAWKDIHQQPKITCHVHGLSPGNRPLGYRTMVIETEWIYDLEWIDHMAQLWPFKVEDLALIFSPSATANLHDHDQIVFS